MFQNRIVDDHFHHLSLNIYGEGGRRQRTPGSNLSAEVAEGKGTQTQSGLRLRHSAVLQFGFQICLCQPQEQVLHEMPVSQLLCSTTGKQMLLAYIIPEPQRMSFKNKQFLS